MKTTMNQRVKLLRTHANKSQSEFASDLKVSGSIISKVEREEEPVSAGLIDKLISIYNVDREWLITGKGEMTYTRPQKQIESPWQDILYKELKERIERQDGIIDRLTQVLAGGKKSFLNALNQTAPAKQGGSRAAA